MQLCSSWVEQTIIKAEAAAARQHARRELQQGISPGGSRGTASLPILSMGLPLARAAGFALQVKQGPWEGGLLGVLWDSERLCQPLWEEAGTSCHCPVGKGRIWFQNGP